MSAYVIINWAQSLKDNFVDDLVRDILFLTQGWWTLGQHTSDRKHFCLSEFTSLIHRVHIRDWGAKIDIQ